MLDPLFWLILFFWTVIPSTKTPWIEFETIPINSKDIILVAIAFLYLLLPAIKKRSVVPLPKGGRSIAAILRPWHYHLPIVTACLLFYATLSVQISGMNARDTNAMIYTLILTASGVLLGHQIIAKRPAESVRSFLWQLTVCLAVLGLLYTVASLSSFQLGDVRGALNDENGDFGIVRVQGPLFGADDGYFVLVPALAFSIQDFIQNPTQRLFKLGVIFVLMLTIIGLGSRGGLMIIGVFICLALFFTKDKKIAGLVALLVIIFITIAGVIVFSKANTERLQSLEDSSRSETYLTSFKIIESRSVEANIFGSGYGSYWPWYLLDIEDGSDVEGGRLFKILLTSYGPTLYHPHSTFLLLIVELGMVGLLYFLFLWSVLIRFLIRDSQKLAFPILGCGIVASAFSMFLNFFLFRLPIISSLWWIFLFGALALNSGESKGKTLNVSPTKNKLIRGEKKK